MASTFNCEPTTVVGGIVVYFSVIAGTYLFGPFALQLITDSYNMSVGALDHFSVALDTEFPNEFDKHFRLGGGG